jgi:hypothetical protein
MPELFLIPEITVEADGESAPVELGDSAGKNILLTLAIIKIVEQQSLDVSIWGSADGNEGRRNLLARKRQRPEMRAAFSRHDGMAQGGIGDSLICVVFF